jgi:DNA-binding XRE family transcriptional regulator
MKARPYKQLHDKVIARPGAVDRLAQLRDETNTEVGLFELRQALKRTQTEQADAMGVSQARISHIEHGQDLKVSTLHEYAKGLGGHLKIEIEFEDADTTTNVAIDL